MNKRISIIFFLPISLAIITSICLCCESLPPSKLITVQKEDILLKGFKKDKELTLYFPFKATEKPTFGPCTINEPICSEFHSENLEVRVCHKYLKQNEWPISKSKSELKSQVYNSLEGKIKDMAKLIRGESTSKLLPIEIEKTGYLDYTKSGYIIEWAQKSIFIDQHFWHSNNEYLDIEFVKLTNNKIKESYAKEEINYIVDSIRGKPGHTIR